MSIQQDYSWIGNIQHTKGQATKLRIIESAIRLFSEKGFANVTLQMIGEDSGTSHPLILKHFGTKNNLLLGVRKFVTFSNHKWVDAKIKPTQTAREKLFCHCIENLRWAIANRSEGKIILLTYYHESLDQSPTQSAGVQALSLGTQRIEAYLQQMQREGFQFGKRDSRMLAEMVHEYLLGVYSYMLTTTPASTKRLPKSYQDKLETFFSLLFDPK
ncbi:MAG: TetR/AcrR family transcriptional regulator [Bdellovibrionales bacterium]|nr:TetR/AcrR family transcriptional regulator [Bdellovibrionales bacterium]